MIGVSKFEQERRNTTKCANFSPRNEKRLGFPQDDTLDMELKGDKGGWENALEVEN